MERIKNKNRTICFYDLESTSVARDADMISVGIVAVTDTDSTNMLGERQRKIKTLYAEFDDFNIDKCDGWVKENIVSRLWTLYPQQMITGDQWLLKGNTRFVSKHLKRWLSQFESVEFWCDYGVIDTPMLIDLIANWNLQWDECERKDHKVGLPKHLPNINYYDFYDIHTLFKVKGIDPDIERQGFSEVFGEELPIIMESTGGKHNALWDAYVTWKCYDKLNII